MIKLTKLFALLLVILVSGCKKCEDDDISKDPCLEYKSTSANFKIEEEFKGKWFESDTVICNSDIHFTAEQAGPGYSYEWHIGNDPRTFGTKQVMLFFSTPTVINVQLIVRRTPSINCDPDDDGIDTINKTMVAIEFFTGYPGTLYPGFVGNYLGHYSNKPNEAITLSIRSSYFNTPVSDSIFEITNYPINNCNDPQFRSFFFNYSFRAVRLYSGPSVINVSCINTTDSWAIVDTSGRYLRIDFKTEDTLGNLIPTYFIGTKQ